MRLVETCADRGADHIVAAGDDCDRCAEAERALHGRGKLADDRSGRDGGGELLARERDAAEQIVRPVALAEVEQHGAGGFGLAGRGRKAEPLDEEILVGCPARRGGENVRFVLLNPENFGKAADIQRRHSAPVEERLTAVGVGEAANLVAAARVKINDGAAHRSSVAVDRDDDVADCGDGQRADRLRSVVVRFADDGADRLPD